MMDMDPVNGVLQVENIQMFKRKLEDKPLR